MPTKEQIIKEAYDNLGGFKSMAAIFNKARERDDTITRSDIKQWKEENVERVKPLTGFNSYVAPEPRHEFQVDLFNYSFMQREKLNLSKQKGRKYTAGIDHYGLLAVDSFTKFVHVEPIDRKKVSSWKKALEAIFKKMGTPKCIYADSDASLLATDMSAYLKKKGIELITTKRHASIAERTIRTIKAELDAKIEKNPQIWTDYLPGVLEEYNQRKVHKTIGMTPAQATEEKNEFKVRNNLEIHRVIKRDQPELHVDDKVRMYKKKGTFDKERVPSWVEGYYRVKKIQNVLGQNLYKLNDHDRLVLRSDLLKLGSERGEGRRAAATRQAERAAARRMLA